MTLHMLRFTPDLVCAAAFGQRQGVAPLGADHGYLWHAVLTAAFGAAAPKPWRLLEPKEGSVASGQPPYLLAYSAAGKEELLAAFARQLADPQAGLLAAAAKAAMGLESFETKPMPEHFPPGWKLRFETRLRPVTRSSMRLDERGVLVGRGGRDGKIEIDVAYHAALAAREADPDAPAPDAETVYRDWLAARLLEGGARLEAGSAKMIWRRRARIVRRDAAGAAAPHGRKGGGPDVGFDAVLTVADPQAFSAFLARGIGRHRAFGFGMLLLKPMER